MYTFCKVVENKISVRVYNSYSDCCIFTQIKCFFIVIFAIIVNGLTINVYMQFSDAAVNIYRKEVGIGIFRFNNFSLNK